KERVMSEKAGVIGPIVTEGVKVPDGYRLTAYREKAPADLWPLVQKMFDPGVKLMKGRPKEGADRTVYVDERDKAAFDRLVGQTAVQGVQDGQLASYPAQLARAVGLSQGRADSRKEVAELYGLPPINRDDPLQGRTPEAFQWTLTGDIDGARRESV